MKKRIYGPPSIYEEPMSRRFTVRLPLDLYEWVKRKRSNWVRELFEVVKEDEKEGV